MPEKGTFSIKTFPLQNKKVVTKIKKKCCRGHVYVDVLKQAKKSLTNNIALQRSV